jgi:hypothetical protein
METAVKAVFGHDRSHEYVFANIISRCSLGGKAALLCLALIGGMLSARAQASECTPVDGTKTYNFPMDYLLQDPTENTIGRID